jgi:molybdopterin molybdotransferase
VRDQERPVLGVEEALSRILDAVDVLSSETVSILDAVGRVLAEQVSADCDIPPLANSAMDGFAVRAADLTDGSVRLRVVGYAAAGHLAGVSVGTRQAVRIMTGAPLPDGADTVVRFEDTHADGDWVEILKAPRAGANVRAAGEDVRIGQPVMESGKVLRPQEVGMLAALGKMSVSVIRRPRVAIIATGDEVVVPDAEPGPGQIRDANSYGVAAQVQQNGGRALVLGVAQDKERLVRQQMRAALAANADIIVTSGGVSIGDFDLVKKVLASEGEMHFWSINMKPARPLAFGVVVDSSASPPRRVPLLGLPGNPVAAMLSMELFGRPALLKMQGFTDWSRPTVTARLSEPISRKDGRRHYLRVRLERTESGFLAILTGGQGSGILNSMVQADGLAVIPESVDHLPAGAHVEIILLPPRGA